MTLSLKSSQNLGRFSTSPKFNVLIYSKNSRKSLGVLTYTFYLGGRGRRILINVSWRVGGQIGSHSESQDSQGYVEITCLCTHKVYHCST